jgi:HSP20 family protein
LKNRNLPALLNKYCRGGRNFPLAHILEDLPGVGGWNPGIDLQENDDELILSADIPGFEPQDLEITVKGNVVILKGDSQRETLREQPGYYCAARCRHSFYRTIPLPAWVKSEQTVAQCNNGVLELKMIKGKSLVGSFRLPFI